ncbi:MAG: DUF6240 domain-containing protein [Lachnospiraceae bacterium]|nr:DUF6240 domain-containing protein [Lachnospiraceae bacterium]
MIIDFTDIKNAESERLSEVKAADFSVRNTTGKAAGGMKAAFSGVEYAGTVRSDSAYSPLKTGKGSRGKTLAESLGTLDSYNAETAHKYMAVMSNTMSAKDFNELMEEGYRPAAMDPKEAVTNLDRIKVTLSKAGVHVAGYTDTVDRSELEKITGNTVEAGRLLKGEQGTDREALSEVFENSDLPATDTNLKAAEKALELGQKIEPLGDGAKHYLVANSLEPTIANVYEAQYSAADGGTPHGGYFGSGDGAKSGYMAYSSGEVDIEALSGQIEEIIENAGLEASAETREEAAWLIEKGLPLTEETLQSLHDINSIEAPLDKNLLVDGIVDAIGSGRAAEDAYLIKNYNAVKAERSLSETRLAMTVDANRKLLKSGYSIDTEELSAEVDVLKEREELYRKILFGGAAGESEETRRLADLFTETLRERDEISDMPVSVLGRFSSAEIFTVHDVYEAGISETEKFRAAGATYEAVGTQVRADLGDSIKNAFANTGELLDDLGLEKSFDNERAVRILGYNSMEISRENIDRVKAADISVRTLMDRLTPANTMELIRRRINPLETDIRELNRIVKGFGSQEGLVSSVKDTEKFSEYLVRLEREEGISDEERNSYIGIYRLFDKINKSDGAVIGSLLDAGRELSFRNLLTEVRSRRHAHMDYTVDDNFGGVAEGTGRSVIKIDTQIESAFQKEYEQLRAEEVFEQLTPRALSGTDTKKAASGETTLDEFTDLIRESSAGEDGKRTHEELYREFLDDAARAAKAEEAVYEMLERFSAPASVENVNAMTALLQERGRFFGDLFKKAGENTEETKAKVEEAAENLIQSLEGEEEAKEACRALCGAASEVLDESLDAPEINSMELRLLHSMNRQLSLVMRLSDEENYEVPVEISGRRTSINLKVIHGTGEAGADITMEPEDIGGIRAYLTETEGRIDGVLAAAYPAGTNFLESHLEDFKERLAESGLMAGDLKVVLSRELNINRVPEGTSSASKPDNNGESTARLYRAAKALIISVRD